MSQAAESLGSFPMTQSVPALGDHHEVYGSEEHGSAWLAQKALAESPCRSLRPWVLGRPTRDVEGRRDGPVVRKLVRDDRELMTLTLYV